MTKLHTFVNNNAQLIPHIKEIVSYFPIGESIDYYPEFKSNMTMRTIILGYEINGHIMHAQNQLEIIIGTRGKCFITLHSDDKEYEFSQVDSFCILLPGKAGEEYKLNFPSKASLGSRGQFRNGNAITLVNRHHVRGMVMLETHVRESVLPKTGYYRNHQMVLLDAQSSSLEYKEQRTHHRLSTHLPVKLQLSQDSESYDCVLANYSEAHLQIKYNRDEALEKLLKAGVTVILTLKLDHLYKTYVIGASILRNHKDSTVLTMREILDEGRSRNFSLMDALNIKACLLQHPGTQ